MHTSPPTPTPPISPTPLQRLTPNLLTASRVVLAVVFIALLASWRFPESPQHPIWTCFTAAVLFSVSAITDALDGFLARRWNVISRFGRVMDPFADKLLVVGAFIMLAGPAFTLHGGAGTPPVQVSGVEPWMAVVILGRELLVTSLRGVLEADGQDFSASMSGKLKMVLQSIVVPLVLVMLAFGERSVITGSTPRMVIVVSVWATVLVTVLSGVPYVTRAIAMLRRSQA